MSEPESSRRDVLNWLMLGMLAWGVVAALGVVVYDASRDRLNLVKPLVIVVVTIVVVGGWRLALRVRRNRFVPREPQN